MPPATPGSPSSPTRLCRGHIPKWTVLTQPGFRDSPEGFQIDRYTVGQGNWTEGYVTMTHEDVVRGFSGGDS